MRGITRELTTSEINQKTEGRFLLEHFELVGAFFNVNEPELRSGIIQKIIAERGRFFTRYHTIICNDLEPKLRKKQIHYLPEQFDVKFILRQKPARRSTAISLSSRRRPRSARRCAQEYSYFSTTICNIRATIQSKELSRSTITIPPSSWESGIQTTRTSFR